MLYFSVIIVLLVSILVITVLISLQKKHGWNGRLLLYLTHLPFLCGIVLMFISLLHLVTEQAFSYSDTNYSN